MKVALCISGHLRSENNYKYIKENIIPYVEVDIFIHTWSLNDRQGNSVNMEFIQNLYQPKKLVMEPQREFVITPMMEQQNFNKRDINGLLSMFYKIEQCNELKKDYELQHNFTYDCVIRYRGDIELLQSINFNVDMNKLHIPLHGDYGGMNDQFAFSNSKNMDVYCSTYSNINDYIKTLTLNPEFFTKETVSRSGLHVERPYIKYVIRWANGSVFDNETRFSPEVMKKHGFS